MNPLVSICCTTFNHERFIRDCFDGFLKQQTNFKFEILVYDDCSTDNTKKIIEEYTAQFPELFFPIYQTENQYSKGVRGIMPRFNFKRARGKYIATCEGDDYWTDPLKLQKQIYFLENNEDFVLTGHDAKKIDDKGELISEWSLPKNKRRDCSSEELQRFFYALTLTMCFRNVPILQQMPDEFYNSNNGDTFLISLLGHYGKYKYMPEITPAVYRIHQGGVWSSKNDIQRIKMVRKTYFEMHLYYKRINNEALFLYYYKKVVVFSFQLLILNLKSSKTIKKLFASFLEFIQDIQFSKYPSRIFKMTSWHILGRL